MRTLKYVAIFAMSNSKSPNFVVIIILGFTVYEAVKQEISTVEVTYSVLTSLSIAQMVGIPFIIIL